MLDFRNQRRSIAISYLIYLFLNTLVLYLLQVTKTEGWTWTGFVRGGDVVYNNIDSLQFNFLVFLSPILANIISLFFKNSWLLIILNIFFSVMCIEICEFIDKNIDSYSEQGFTIFDSWGDNISDWVLVCSVIITFLVGVTFSMVKTVITRFLNKKT